MTAPTGSRGPILAIDTATSVAVVALGDPAGTLIGEATWTAGHRHGEELLARIDRLLAETGTTLSELDAIVVGTGPGAFTGLRVGLATAKGLAHGLAIPIVGVSTGVALLHGLAGNGSGPSPTYPGPGSAPPFALLLPAGPSGRILVEPDGRASLASDGGGRELDPRWTAVAIDLPERAADDALARGELARGQLARSLLALGAAALQAGHPSDLATLVPDYVSLPRGVHSESGEVAWSRDPR